MEQPNHGTRKTNEVEEIWLDGAKRRRRGSEEPCSHHNEEGYKALVASATKERQHGRRASIWAQQTTDNIP